MDKRKLIAALAIGGSLAVGSLFLGPEDPVSGSYRGGYYGGAGSFAGGYVAPDTFRLLVRDELENTIAIANGWVDSDDNFYDQVREDVNTGDYCRWGCFTATDSLNAYWSVNGGLISKTTEDNSSSYAYRMVVAFKTSGLTSGHKVEECGLMINVFRTATNNLTTGYVAARLDTLIDDYDMLAMGSVQADSSNLNTSWHDLSIEESIPWDPIQMARDDTHDWGPRSLPNYPGASLTDTDGIRLDLTDAMQQALDNGFLEETDGWVIFFIYQVGTPTSASSWAYGSDPAKVLYGNPCLTVTTSSVRGPMAWGGGGLPFYVEFDDTYAEQEDCFTAVQDSGLAFYALTCSTAIYNNPTWDAFNTANGANINYIAHTLSHVSLGDVTGATLDAELRKNWWVNTANFTDVPDTSLIIDFGWAGGGGNNYGIEAIEKMVDFGYRTSRASTYGWTAHQAVGLTTYLSWDAPVNMYMIEADFLLFGTASNAFTQAEIKEHVTDHIDLLYTNGGRAAYTSFTHKYSMNGVTEANLRYLIGLINQLNGIQHMSMEEIINRRDGTRIAPSTIAAMDIPTPDSTAIKASAAMHDSLISLTGHDNLLEIWIGGK